MVSAAPFTAKFWGFTPERDKAINKLKEIEGNTRFSYQVKSTGTGHWFIERV